LTATKARCILAYWHLTRFFTPSRQAGVDKIDAVDRKMSPFWADLQAAGADIVLSGHRHVYERFARQDAESNADSSGMRQFVVGAGGGPPHPLEGPRAPNRGVRKAVNYRAPQLTRPPGTDR